MEPFTLLPTEINQVIQSYFDVKNAAIFSRTCQKFHGQIINDDSLWKKFYPEIIFPKEIPVKQCLDLQAVWSTDKLWDRISEFVNKLLLCQKGKLSVEFPFNLERNPLLIEFENYTVPEKHVDGLLFGASLADLNLDISFNEPINERLIYMKSDFDIAYHPRPAESSITSFPEIDESMNLCSKVLVMGHISATTTNKIHKLFSDRVKIKIKEFF